MFTGSVLVKARTLTPAQLVVREINAWRRRDMTHEEVDREAATSPDTCKDCLHGLKDAWGKCGSLDRKLGKLPMDIAPETAICEFYKNIDSETPLPEPNDIDETFFTDVRNANRLSRIISDARYSYSHSKWLVFDGKRWSLDHQDYIIEKAKIITNDIIKEALTVEGDGRQKAVRSALACESSSRIEGMVKLTRSIPGIKLESNILDKQIMLFNVQNGTLNLVTGELNPHDRNDYITKISPVTHDINATCPIWLSFIDTIFAGNKNIIEYMQRKAGYMLTGDTSEEEFDQYYGTGGNGKSKYVNELLVHIFGLDEYGLKANFETIQESSKTKDGNAASTDVARLQGARLVVVSEPKKGTVLNEQRVKDWTGRDPITARHLYQEPVTFVPEFKLIIYTNYKLRIHGTDNGIWRRNKLLPFEVTIPGDEIDRHLDIKLSQESAGIFNWMVAGCLKWQKDGLKVPSEILEATEEYRDEQDYLGDFFERYCNINTNSECLFGFLYLTYRAYCRIFEMKTQSQNGFAETLVGKKCKKFTKNIGKFYSGITLKPEILAKCIEIKTSCKGRFGDDVTTMTAFLESIPILFHIEDFPILPSQSSPSSLKTLTHIESPELIKMLSDFQATWGKGSVNSSNETEFAMKFCDQKKPQWQKDGDTGYYVSEDLQNLIRKIFKITPVTDFTIQSELEPRIVGSF